MPNRRRTNTSTSPLAKAGQMLGGLLSSRASGSSQTRTSSRGGRRQSQATGLSKLLRSVRR